MRLIFVAMLSLLTSCLGISYVAPELIEGTVISMSDRFFEHCGGRERVPFIAITSRMPEGSSPTAIGHCTNIPGGAVYLRLDWWLAASDIERFILLAHEISHSRGFSHNENNWVMQSHMMPKLEALQKTEQDVYDELNCQL